MEYKKEKFIMNYLCEFKDKEVEADFREYDRSTSLRMVRLLTLLVGIVFALFAFSDLFYHGQDESFPLSLGLRGIAVIVTIFSFFVTGRIKHYDHTLLLVTGTELTVFFIYLLNLYVQDSVEPALQFMSVMIFLLAVFLIPNRWKNCVVASVIMLSSYLVFCVYFLSPTNSPSLPQRGIYLGICLVCTAILIYGREHSRRRQYATEKLLEHMSITDKLTGIFNRGRFEYVLGLWIKNNRHDPFCLILFDIDDFKKVNDNYGHTVGDQVLKSTSAVVTSHIRDNDIFARWGGEEFVILFSQVNLDMAVELAERLRKAVESNNCGEAGRITISIGVTEYRRGETILELVNRADAKMYEAKKAGKNKVVADTALPVPAG